MTGKNLTNVLAHEPEKRFRATGVSYCGASSVSLKLQRYKKYHETRDSRQFYELVSQSCE